MESSAPNPDDIGKRDASTGLSSEEVKRRQIQYGLNLLSAKKAVILKVFIRQFTSNPLIIILAAATSISYVLGQHTSSYYIFAIIIASVLLGFWNEYTAEKTIENLLKKITLSAIVMRDGIKQEVPVSHLTIGDIVFVSQGSIVPADLRLIESRNLQVNQSTLTGESVPVDKNSSSVTRKVTVAEISNMLFMGTTVVSGFGTGVVAHIGKDTEFGKIAQSISFLKPITEFQKGLAGFSRLIIKVVLILITVIFIINALLGHQLIESLLFALAIAVGLTPELLPIIVTVSLTHGAGKLAKKHVVAKQLLSIENLGNMDILCTDKTGTLTEGEIRVVDFIDSKGNRSLPVLNLSLLCNNAIVHHKITGDVIDVALWKYALKNHIAGDRSFIKKDGVPFDYDRKAMFVVAFKHGTMHLIAKGAPDEIFALCNIKAGSALHEKFHSLSKNGYRVIALATKQVANKKLFSWEDLSHMNFEGFVVFLDTPKQTAKEALARFDKLHVQTKLITGDNELVTQHICQKIGMDTGRILTGDEIDRLSGPKLQKKILETQIFARINPRQKLKIINTLQELGHTVGYLGDGINDVPSLHGADVGISVNTAIDVAKDASSVVLLRKSLNVIAEGIEEGRRTFNNTIKYILMAISSNFGNMFSAAGASFFLSFLPLTPVQILLNNGLYDISQISIPTDNVDPESLLKPRHWNMDFVKNYMLFFGPLSSIFDFITFAILLFAFHAKGSAFQTGWFIESIATQILVVFVIRTARVPFFKSRPSPWLLTTCLLMAFIGVVLPFTPLANSLGLVPPSIVYFVVLVLLVTIYLTLVEIIKNRFLKNYQL